MQENVCFWSAHQNSDRIEALGLGLGLEQFVSVDPGIELGLGLGLGLGSVAGTIIMKAHAAR